MTVTIIISEDMIQCFNQCARIGEYQPFLQEHYAALQTVIQNLKSASFPKELVCTFVSIHLKECMQYLIDADSKAANFLLRRAPALYEHMRYSIYQGNWNSFYWDYRSKLDYMIEKARNQKVINFQIEFQGAYFESFESRDIAGNYRKPDGRCLPEYFTPTPVITQEKNVCKVEPVQKEKLKKLDTKPTEPDVTAIESNETGQLLKSVGPTSTSLTTANSAAVAADIMNSVTETQAKNEQFISFLESELDPDKSDRMKMRELKNMMKDLKSDFHDHKNQVEQKLTEQTTQIQNLENSFKDEIAQLKLTINSRDEQFSKQMDQLVNMMTLMMQNSSAMQAKAERVDSAQNMGPNPLAPETQEPFSRTLPIRIDYQMLSDSEQFSFTSSGIFSMPSLDNSQVGSLQAVQTDRFVPTGNLIDFEGSSISNSPGEFQEDEEIRKMKEDFEIKLAEQKRLHDIELQEARERREEKNREAEAERELRFGKLTNRPSIDKQE
ncbi:unnamed protein product [Caenorhabditis brenneri]